VLTAPYELSLQIKQFAIRLERVNCVIPFQEVVHRRRFSLVKFMLCSRNNSNYSGNWLNYLLRIILLSVCNSVLLFVFLALQPIVVVISQPSSGF
jgi:hypothetical protein